jgi:hypothetical protein
MYRREHVRRTHPPESLNAAGPHGPLIRQPLASSLRFRYKCAVKSLTVSSVQKYMYNNIVVITGELLQACWSEKVLLPSNKSHFEFGSEMARHRRQIVLGKPKVSSGQQLLYLINDFRTKDVCSAQRHRGIDLAWRLNARIDP